MSLAATCVIAMLSLHNAAGDSTAQFNLDGSWTVYDWPAIAALASEPVRMPIAGGSEGNAYIFGDRPRYEVLLARALVAARDAGHLYENVAPNNECPEE